jgi:hypothetical protein
MKVRELIKEQLLLEKRIAQLSSTIEVTFGFDVIKTTHAEKRKDVTKRELGHERMISNAEMKEVVSNFKREIAEGIVDGDIENETNFVIKNKKFGLAMVLVAEHVSGNYWKLVIKTVFRETPENPLRVGHNQIVYSK